MPDTLTSHPVVFTEDPKDAIAQMEAFVHAAQEALIGLKQMVKVQSLDDFWPRRDDRARKPGPKEDPDGIYGNE